MDEIKGKRLMAQVRTVPSLEIARLVGDRVLAPIEFRDPLTALPGGLFRLNPAGTLYTIERNTAVAGDFSTYTTPLAISATDQVGINISSPQDALHVGANGTNGSGAIIERVTNDNGPVSLSTWKARGTFAAKTIVSNGDPLLKIQAMGYDGATYQPAAEIAVEVVGTPGAGDMPGNVVVSTTTDGTVILTERMRIDDVGRTRISDAGTGTPAASSLLDLVSTTKGLLAPRMTTAQRDLIGSPATGLLIYNTTTGALQHYTGAAWANISIDSGWTDDGTVVRLTTSTDSVGIGTALPDAKFHVKADAGAVTPTAYPVGIFSRTAVTTDIIELMLLGGATGSARLYFGDGSIGNRGSIEYDNSVNKMRFATVQSTRMTIDSAGKVGMGTDAPATNCHQVGTTLVGYRADRYSADATAPGFQGYKSRGTVSVPVIVNDGDSLISIEAFGYDGASFIQAGFVRVKCNATPGVGDMPGMLSFGVTLDGASAPTERMQLLNQGRLLLGIQGTPAGTAGKFMIVNDRASDAVDGAMYIEEVGGATTYRSGHGDLRARGSLGTKTAIQNNDGIAAWDGLGFGATIYGVAAGIWIDADGNFTDTNFPGRIIFNTTSGATASERMAITNTVINMTVKGGFGFPRGGMSAASQFYVACESGSLSPIEAIQFSADTAGAYEVLRKARGTRASPASISSGDNLAGDSIWGYHTGAYRQGGYTLWVQAGGTPSGTSMPVDYAVATTPASSITPVERMRISNAGNISIGNNPGWGTSAARVLSHALGTAPSTSPVDAYQQYAADIVAGNTAPHFRTELGNVIKLFTSAAYTPTNVTTDRAYDANATSVDELADVVGTLISDLQATGLIG